LKDLSRLPDELPWLAYRKGLIPANENVLLSVPPISATDVEDIKRAAVCVCRFVTERLTSPNSEEQLKTLRWLGVGDSLQALLHWRAPKVSESMLMRADFLSSENGPKLIEINAGGLVGGIVNASLRHLVYGDGQESCLQAWEDHFKAATSQFEAVAVVNPAKVNIKTFREFDLLHRLMKTSPRSSVRNCTVDEVAFDGSALTVGSETFSAVYPRFLPWSVDDVSGDYQHLVDAAERGAIQFSISPLSRLVASKGALAFFWHAIDSGASTEEEAFLGRRFVARTFRLGDPAASREPREALVLKPSLGASGKGVIVGQECPDNEWSAALDSSGGDGVTRTVLQEFIPTRASTYECARPGKSPEVALGRFVWSVYVYRAKVWGDPLVRALPLTRGLVVNASRGAVVGIGSSVP